MGWWNDPTTRHAYILSWVSLAFTLLAVFAGLGLFISADSSLALVFGLENIVDFLSSAVVLWRFFAPGAKDPSPELVRLLDSREERASMAISLILVVLGISVTLASLVALSQGQEEEKDLSALIAISFFSIIIFGFLTVIKFRYAAKLNSPSLYKDGLCSTIGCILSLSLFIDSLIIQKAPAAWWIDPIVALLGGIGALFLGGQAVWVAVYKDKIPLFTPTWWAYSHGEGGDHGAKEETQPDVVEAEVV